MPRRQDDFDDDDYLPPEASRVTPRGFPHVLFWVAVLGVVVVVGLSLFFLRSSRQAAAERNMVEVSRAEMEVREQPNAPAARASNWNMAIGTWQREPKGKNDTDYPYRFEFRNDFTATMKRINFDGSVQVKECKVEVFVDEREELAIRLHVENGVYSYRFRFPAHGTIVLDDGATGLTFRRAS